MDLGTVGGKPQGYGTVGKSTVMVHQRFVSGDKFNFAPDNKQEKSLGIAFNYS